jgi:hypothetical protein
MMQGCQDFPSSRERRTAAPRSVNAGAKKMVPSAAIARQLSAESNPVSDMAVVFSGSTSGDDWLEDEHAR